MKLYSLWHRLMTLVIFLCFSLLSQGQTILSHQKVYSDSRAYSYKSIDLNNDGLLDIVSFTSANQKVEMYLNQGNFVFKFVDASVGEDNKEIKGEVGFVDYDNDGDMDLVSAQCPACANNEVTLYENNDFKTFDKKFILLDKFGGFGDLTYQSGDFDNDGFQDLILTGDGTKIFYNTGQNSFEDPLTLSGVNGNYFDAQDLNQDGLIDLILFNSNAAYTFLNSTDGFGDATILEGAAMGFGYIEKYDINKDGINDYYVDSDDCLKACLSNGTGTFFNPTENIFCGNFLETKFAPIHANGDDEIDVLSGANAGDGIFLRANNGSGFEDKRLVGNQGFQINYFLVDDFNNDGISDVVYYDKWRDLAILEGVLDPELYYTHMIATDTKVRIQMIDNDSQSDLIVFDETWLGINLFDTENGEFKGLQTLFNFVNWVVDAKTADMDGDGDSDLVIVLDPDVQSSDQSSVLWAEQIDGTFENLHVIQSSKRDYSSLNVEDFDKDGDMDIVVHRISSGGEYLLNNGDNTFSSTPIYARGRYTRKLDFNQDGFTDIIAWENGGSTFHYIENDQAGGFKANKKFGDEQTIYDVETYDYDQDGDLDAILSVYEGETTKIKLLENEDFTFENSMVINNEYVGTDLVLLPISEDQLGIVGSYTLDTYLQNGSNNWQLIDGPTEESYTTIDLFLNTFDGRVYILAVGSDDPGIHLYGTALEVEDKDNDGFSSDVDCDDSDADINPDAEEIANNDIDENCDGIVLIIDVDMDGFNSDEDCDDEDPEINPDATEIPGNGIDENCDGLDIIVLLDEDNDGFLSDVDCDDNNQDINPNELENISNDFDDNCDYIIGDQIYSIAATVLHDEDVNDFLALDIDADGVKDLVFATSNNVYYTSHIDNFATKHEMITIVQSSDYTNLKAVDMDDDGDKDLVCMSMSDQKYQVIINYDGTFVSQASFDEVEDMISFDLADINGDDLPDMVYVRSNDASFKRLGYKLNNGFRYFGDESTISNAISNLVSVHLTDINADDNMDIIVRKNDSSAQLRFYRGDGETDFAAGIEICTICNEIGALTFADWDNKPSLLFSNIGNNGLAEGIYSWSFGVVGNDFTFISDAVGVNNLEAAQVNGNCNIDLVYSSTFSKNMAVILDEDQSFGLQSSLEYTMDIIVDDLTGDQKNDIAFFHESNGGITILENLLTMSDYDMDGFDTMEDCDDCDAMINPAAEENLENGIDDNCDGVLDDLDEDMDGYGQLVDCDDTNPDVNPGAEEIPDNGIDDDCFGGDEQSQYNITTFAEAKEVDSDGNLVNEGQWAKLTGIIHGINYLESSTNVLMVLSNSNDEGIWVFSYDDEMDIPEEGDEVMIRGEMMNFNGLAELVIHSIEYLSNSNDLFEPKHTDVIGEEEEGDFVRLRNFQFLDENSWKGDGSSFNVPISNGADLFTLRIDNDSELASSPIPNSPFDVIGLVGQFDQNSPYTGAYQVFPRYISDFQAVTDVQDVQSTIRIYPTLVDSKLFLDSDVPVITGKIYTAHGILVKTFTGSEISVVDLTSGFYILKSNVGSARFVKR